MIEPVLTAVYGTAAAEYTIKKSRFIASLQAVQTPAEAAAFVEQTRKRYWDARHNCYAYQLGADGTIQKSSDDGEPAGTAGRPMLDVLKKGKITNTVVVVTRYFGGIKLGASGLIRAYSHAVTVGLEAAQLADYRSFTKIAATIPYSFVSLMERTAPHWQITIRDRQFADTVTFILQVPSDQAAAWQADWTNQTNGQTTYRDEGTELIPILRPKPQEQTP